MKILLYLLLFSSIVVNAQNNLKIIYEYNDYGGYKKDLIINVKNNLAHFIFHKDKETLVNEEGMEFYHFYKHYENYINLSTKHITEQRILKDNTELISEWKLDLVWEITDETKEINGYPVQKAIIKSYNDGAFDYGNAIVWFTEKIPIGVGPLRYYGLPGLIVLIEFELKQHRKIILKEIKFDEVIKEIVVPSQGVKVSKEEIITPRRINKKWLRKQKKQLRNKKGQQAMKQV